MFGLAGSERPRTSSAARRRIQQLVLHFGEELVRAGLVAAVVAGEGEQVADLLVEAFFGGTDVSDAGEEFVEVVRAAVGILEARVVHREAFDEVFAQVRIRPLPELGSPDPADAEPHGQNHLQGVIEDLVLLAVPGSCKIKLYN